MRYTDKNYYIENSLVEKMDLWMKRACETRQLDAVIICDGDEGFGKTSISIECLYYIAYKTGRAFSVDQLFFDPEEFIKRINNTKEQLLLWDEAALGGLASGWQSKIQQLLIQTLMTCRYRKHIIIFNCPKFYRLNSYFVMDRALGLIHVYSPDNITAGKFTYYKKDVLEGMYNIWSQRKRKPYKIVPHVRGSFVDAFGKAKILNEEDYIKKKDYYTSRILDKYEAQTSDINPKLLKLQYNITRLGKTLKKKCNISASDIAKVLEVQASTYYRWEAIKDKYPKVFKKKGEEDED